MPKTKISEYSVTNSSNTDIEGINIDEGCAPSGINNAIRELMVHLKEFQTGASGDAFTFAGGVLISGTANTITGNVLMSGTNTITGSTTATFAAGAVGTPSIAAHGDTNTGIFFPAADTIAFAEGGAEAMRINSSGNVGIGTNNPGSRLDIYSATNSGQLNLYGANQVALSLKSTGNTSGFLLGRSQASNDGNDLFIYDLAASAFRLNIDSSGNVGIGTTSPGRKLQVSNTAADPFISIIGAANNEGGLLFGDNASDAVGQIRYMHNGDYMYFNTNGSERARITSGGRLCVNSTSVLATNYYISVTGEEGVVARSTSNGGASFLSSLLSANSGGYHFYGYNASTPAAVFYVEYDGDVRNTNNSYAAISDIRLKQDITDAASQWDDIKNLQIRKYRFKNNPEGPLQIGLIAQEVETVSPGLVDETNDRDIDNNDLGTTTKSVKYSVLYMKAVKALQEAMTRIEALEAQNAAFEARLVALEAK